MAYFGVTENNPKLVKSIIDKLKITDYGSSIWSNENLTLGHNFCQ